MGKQNDISFSAEEHQVSVNSLDFRTKTDTAWELFVNTVAQKPRKIDEVPDEPLFSVAKMTEILGFGSDPQRTVILFELPQLLEHFYDETLNIMIPVLCKLVPSWSSELQISVSESLLDVVQKTESGHTSKMICDAAFQVITVSRTADIFEAWGEILVIVLPKVQWNENGEISSVIAILDEFAVSEEDICRKLVARVLGSFSCCLSTAEVETYILKRALQLTNDPNIDVRGMVSESLAFVGEVIEIDVVENRLWPKLLFLLEDSDARIHAATLQTIAHIVEAHKEHRKTSALFKRLLPPVFAKECEFARVAAEKDQRRVDDDTYLLLEIISEVFGPFVFAVHQYLTEESGRLDAFRAFLAMATCNGPVVRRYCAFNLPGIAKSLGDSFKTELSGIAEFLSRDSDPETRWNLAAGMHETTKLLMCKSSADNLFKTAESLLQDRNPLVRINALEHFYDLISSLTESSELCYRPDKKFSIIFHNLRLFSNGSWRTQELLAKQLEQVSAMVPPECLSEHVLPLLYTMAEESTYLVRKAAMVAIAKAIWCIPSVYEREKAAKYCRVEWGEGGIYWMRIAFIDCAIAALGLFSAELFQLLFAPALFKLAHDEVGNVRLRLAQMIHDAAPICCNSKEFHHALGVLRSDTVRDVQEVMTGIDARIGSKMMDTDSFYRTNQEREAAEAELQNKLERAKEARKKTTAIGRVRASVAMTKLGGKGSTSPRESRNSGPKAQQNSDACELVELSPVSVVDGEHFEEKDAWKSKVGIQNKGREIESDQLGETGEEPSLSPTRKSVKNILRLGSGEQSPPVSPRRSRMLILKVGSGDAAASSSGNRKTLKQMLSHVGSGFRSK